MMEVYYFHANNSNTSIDPTMIETRLPSTTSQSNHRYHGPPQENEDDSSEGPLIETRSV